MADKGMSDPEIRATVADLDLTVAEFGLDQALGVARLRPVTKHRGLSLADEVVRHKVLRIPEKVYGPPKVAGGTRAAERSSGRNHGH